jgi:hypothetical protein
MRNPPTRDIITQFFQIFGWVLSTILNLLTPIGQGNAKKKREKVIKIQKTTRYWADISSKPTYGIMLTTATCTLAMDRDV